MKIDYLVVLLVSAIFTSNASFSFAELHGEPSCHYFEKFYGACILDNHEVINASMCLATCFTGADKLKLKTCESGCDLTKKCGGECTPACTDKLLALVDCHFDKELGPDVCSCFVSSEVDVSEIESFALGLSNSLKKKSNLRA